MDHAIESGLDTAEFIIQKGNSPAADDEKELVLAGSEECDQHL
jgi:hypothetical protein